MAIVKMYAAACSYAVLGFILETSNSCRSIGSSTIENATLEMLGIVRYSENMFFHICVDNFLNLRNKLCSALHIRSMAFAVASALCKQSHMVSEFLCQFMKFYC